MPKDGCEANPGSQAGALQRVDVGSECRRDAALVARFQTFVGQRAFPCLGAKSAVGSGRATLYVARDIRSGWDDLAIHQAVRDFAAIDSNGLRSFIVLFRSASALSETNFETALWQRLQSWSDKDGWLGFDQASATSPSPLDPNFALSFGGKAFFAVGLHPGANRASRRFSHPAIILNPHEQFRMLRRSGQYDGMKAKILARDAAYSGCVNPMIAPHGTVSEARQYSGRIVDEHWACPFAPPARKGI